MSFQTSQTKLGVTYDSHLEERIAESNPLLNRIQSKTKPYTYTVMIRRQSNPDFQFLTKKGTKIFVEAKGRLVTEYKQVLQRLTPTEKACLILCFSNPFQRVTSTSSTRIWQWCERNKIKWCSESELPSLIKEYYETK